MKQQNITIIERQQREKDLLLSQLKKAPIIQLACEKLSIGRTTYYRWRKEDKEFRQQADQALREGKELMNDLAESQLLKAVKEGNLTGIIFWLKNNHISYKTKIEVSGELVNKDEPLTLEQEKLIHQALKLIHYPISNNNTYDQQ